MSFRPILHTVLFVAGAAWAALAATPAYSAQSRAFVVTTDFQTGGMSAIDLSTRAVSVDVASVHKDARARWHGGLIYVLNRFGADNVQILNPATGYSTVRQFSVGNGANPSDIVVVSRAPGGASGGASGGDPRIVRRRGEAASAGGGDRGALQPGGDAAAEPGPAAARLDIGHRVGHVRGHR